MAEYFGQTQLVSLNEPIEFASSIPCTKGCVYHEDGTTDNVAVDPTPTIQVSNSNLTITRIA